MADQAQVNQTRIFDANGDPVPGALINVYASGTLARIDVWLDQAQTTLATNPVIADANGAIPQIFVAGGAANIVVTTATGASLYALDPAPLSPTSGSAASLVSFSPTTAVPFANVQDAIVGVDATLRGLILAGGAGVVADAVLLASLDATTTAGGAYRFSAATTGTFPTGVVAADTGAVLITRQSATAAVMEMYALGKAFRRVLSTSWGAWLEIIAVSAASAQGDVIRRGASGWERLAKGTAGQSLVMDNTAANVVWANSSVLLGTITTTSGTSQSLASLVLTPYRFLRFTFAAVSGDASITLTIDSVQCSAASGSAAALMYGFADIDLSNGVVSGIIGTPGNNFAVYAGVTSYRTSSTSVTVGASGGSFDAGSVLVYGVR